MTRFKAKMAKKALKKLLKPKEKEILAMGYKSIDEFIKELEGVPVEKLLKFKKNLKK